MYFDYKENKLNATLRLTDNVGLIAEDASIKRGLIHILWNQGNNKVHFWVDGLALQLKPNQIATLTYLHAVRFELPLPENLTVISFNREFYCINDHDHEVSCNGLLFMGSDNIPILDIDKKERYKMETLLEVFKDEFETKDNIQGEMLQMLLKRLIIKCTRLAREQVFGQSLDKDSTDLIRKFNVLVDTYYKSHKQVADYADMMFKSPKTLSNVFKLHGSKSPLQVIHNRIATEARRQLLKTDKSAKEIAFDLGFDEVSSFNKMFKKCTNQTPVEFKKDKLLDREKSTIIQE